MFERFTHAARDAVVRAQTEARELHHPRIGTEHLLLALVADPAAPIAVMLGADGVTHETVRADLTRLVGPAPARALSEEPLNDTDPADAEALRAIGIDIEAVRRAIEENFGPDALRLPPAAPPRRRGLLRRRGEQPRTRGHIPFSPRAKKTLELSLREALRLKHNFIAPEHILLGIIREGGGLGSLILTDAGVDLDDLRGRAAGALKHPAA